MMNNVQTIPIEQLFFSLPQTERLSIISYGVTLQLSTLRKRLILANEKIRSFEEKYQTTLKRLEATGLPDTAGYELHEDYIMWHHWVEVAEETKKRVPICLA